MHKQLDADSQLKLEKYEDRLSDECKACLES